MKIAIVEDEPLDAECLQTPLKRYAGEKALPIMLAVVLSEVMMGALAKAQYDTSQTDIFRIVLIYDLLLSLCLLTMLRMYKKSEQVKIAAEEEKHLRRLEQQQYEQMQKNIENINHKCHDLKHQISLLRSETCDGNRDQLLRELEQDVMIYESRMHTGYAPLDELLTEKLPYCEREGVQWTCMADGAAISFIKPIDLYTLLGNALENAVENAAQRNRPKNGSSPSIFFGKEIWR